MGNFGDVLPPKLFVRISVLLFLILHNVSCQYAEGRRLKPCELESLLRELTYPEEGYEMHAAALRNQLRNILERDPTDGGYQTLDDYAGYETAGPYEDKRSYRSLLRDGAVFGKRNLGSLARAGLLRTPSNDYLKRSIATLAKNGQLPSNREPNSEEDGPAEEWSEDKRNLASAFRSGYMRNGKRNIASLARKYELPGKRNIQSLLRTGMLPSIAPKRNMQSLARDNALPHYGGLGGNVENKRNIQTLVRDWNLPKHQGSGTGENEKRNIQSLKNAQSHNGESNSGRKKRELYYEDGSLDDSTPEILEPVYQSAPLDYEELMEAMSEAYPYYAPSGNHLEEKRYLGSLARSGMLSRFNRYHKRFTWSLGNSYDDNDDADDNGDSLDDIDDDDRDTDFHEQTMRDEDEHGIAVPQKRHIAALARSGWLPAFRPSRAGAGRFSRSGRARSQIVEFYLQPERLRQPTAGVCRRCDTSSDSSGFRGAPSPFFASSSGSSSSSSSWGTPGLQSTWGSAPPRLTALHWRRFRDSSPNVRRRITRGAPAVLRRLQ